MSRSAISVRHLWVLISALALAAIGRLVMPVAALAGTRAYPAPPVDPAVQAATPTDATDPGISLASNNGSERTIGTPFVIGAVVLLVGLAMLILMTRPSKAKHHPR